MFAINEIKPWWRRILTTAYSDPEAAKFRSVQVALGVAREIIERREMDFDPVTLCVDQALNFSGGLPYQAGELRYDFVTAYGAHWKEIDKTYDPTEALNARHITTGEFVRTFEAICQKNDLPLAWSFQEEGDSVVYLIGLATLNILNGRYTFRFTVRTNPDFHGRLSARVLVMTEERVVADLGYDKLLAIPGWSLRNSENASHVETVHHTISEILAFTKLIVDESPTIPVDWKPT